MNKDGTITALCKNVEPGLPKVEVAEIDVIEKHGVAGDYHAGKYVRHRYLAKKDPTRLNLRQILLVDNLIYDNISAHGIQPVTGMLGENIVVDGIDLMRLSIGTRILINNVLLEITEVREPCYQLNKIHPKLQEVVMPDEKDEKSWNAGMMAVVLRGGSVKRGDPVKVLDSADTGI